MNRNKILPVAAVLFGAASFVLRLVQNRTGFEAATGLPVPGSGAALGLLALLLAGGAVLGLLAWRLPRAGAFPESFTSGSRSLAAPGAAGCVLLALGGAADLAEGAGIARFLGESELLSEGEMGLAPAMQLICGVLGLLTAGTLLYALRACLRETPFRGEALLAAPVALVVRLVFIYRVDSVNPNLASYAPELAALILLTVAFYCLAALAYEEGGNRRFALSAGCAAVVSFCALADGGAYLSSLLLYAGGALTLLSFLALRLCREEGASA